VSEQPSHTEKIPGDLSLVALFPRRSSSSTHEGSFALPNISPYWAVTTDTEAELYLPLSRCSVLLHAFPFFVISYN